MIQRYSFGALTLADNTYHADVLVFPDQIVSNWWRAESHLLQPSDLAPVMEFLPEVLVVGTGINEQMKISPEVAAMLHKAGVELIAFDTRTACGIFNRLIQKRRAVAALHLTCQLSLGAPRRLLRYPFITPSGRMRATSFEIPAPWQTSTTSRTSL